MSELDNRYTPEEVFENQEELEAVSKRKLIGKGFIVASCIIVIIMGIIFLISSLYSENGSFTVKMGDFNDEGWGISLSETYGFANPTTRLSGIPNNSMTNITYTDLPIDELDAIPGSHNGENYIAYTFYVRNSSENNIDFTVSFDVVKATRGVDKAVRVMIYRDGVPTIYAQPKNNGSPETVPEQVVSFESDATVVKDELLDIAPGEIHRYSVIIWLEGNDPECVDDILKGVMQFEVNLNQIMEDD